MAMGHLWDVFAQRGAYAGYGWHRDQSGHTSKVGDGVTHDQVIRYARYLSDRQPAKEGDVPGPRDSPDTTLLTPIGRFVFLFPRT